MEAPSTLCVCACARVPWNNSAPLRFSLPLVYLGIYSSDFFQRGAAAGRLYFRLQVSMLSKINLAHATPTPQAPPPATNY